MRDESQVRSLSVKQASSRTAHGGLIRNDGRAMMIRRSTAAPAGAEPQILAVTQLANWGTHVSKQRYLGAENWNA